MRRAYTLIELVVTMGIIAVVAVFVLINLFGKKTSNDYKNTAQEALALLHEAQSRSKTQLNGTSWGVYFSNATDTTPYFALFSGTTFNTSTMADRYALPSDVCYSSLLLGSSTAIIFNTGSGALLNSSSSVSVALQSTAQNGCNQQSSNQNHFSAWSTLSANDVGTYDGYFFNGNNGYFYSIDSLDEYGNGETSTVFYAPVSSDGTIGMWAATTPIGRAWSDDLNSLEATAMINNGYIYSFGGDDANGQPTSTVLYAPLNSDGTVGTWENTAPIPDFPSYAVPVASNGYAYIFGYCPFLLYDESDCSYKGTTTSTVYYAPINDDGSIGTWATTTPLPAPPYLSIPSVNNGYIYSFVELTDDNGGETSTVFYAPLNSDGSIGTWATTTPVPVPFLKANVSIRNGYFYVLNNIRTPFQFYFEYAPIRSDGSIGTWATTTPVLDSDGASYGDTTIVNNNYFYILNTLWPQDAFLYSSFSSLSSIVSVNPQGLISSQ